MSNRTTKAAAMRSVGEIKRRLTNSSPPRSLAIAARGIETADQLASLMGALISDVLSDTVKPQVANAAINAAGKLLKTVDMQQKYGLPHGQTQEKRLILCNLKD